MDRKLTDMGRAFYRFGHDVALRVANGQAFALKDAELGALFGADQPPRCFLRGSFTPGTLRALVARGLIAPQPELQALAQPVKVQLNLKPEIAANVGKDAATLHHLGRRLDQNLLTDEFARRLLAFEMWQLASATPLQGASVVLSAAQGAILEEATPLTTGEESPYVTAAAELVSDLASELWLAAEAAGEAAQGPPLEKAMALEEAALRFFEDEGWGWEAVAELEGLLRTTYDGQNGSWMCYTRILPELEQVIFYSICPVSVPTSTQSTMLAYLCRLNAELSVGNFEFDFDHNVVRFRTGIDVTDVGLAPLLFRNLVFQNLAVMDIYLPEILGIVVGAQPSIS